MRFAKKVDAMKILIGILIETRNQLHFLIKLITNNCEKRQSLNIQHHNLLYRVKYDVDNLILNKKY